MSLPLLRTTIPGPRSRQLAQQLRRVESRNVTYISNRWPIFWERARGANVWDADGNRYIDLTAAFGVASVGHANPRVVAAVQRQAARLIHAMGDVHPNELKLQLAHELIALTFGRWCSGASVKRRTGRVVFGNSGAEAVEIAMKTAVIHTGKPGVIAFTGGYHGLTYGALAVTHRQDFRSPFAKQLGNFVRHIPFGTLPRSIAGIGAVLVEPIQGRNGIVVPTEDFLPALRRFCDRHKLLLIFDEVYTGFCRTGRWFACEHWNVMPDILCVGKALTGGLPLSACIGRADVMDSWPKSTGEAIHTSTFLGNPVACAAGLASIAEMKRMKLDQRAADLGTYALRHLPTLRGKGLMLGLPVKDPARSAEELLRCGILALPEGEVLGLTPPLTISRRELDYCLDVLMECCGLTQPSRRRGSTRRERQSGVKPPHSKAR
jgi:4-aminobutyrate aminotransferase/(S)-3-amino-2-methylpropionate transaminase